MIKSLNVCIGGVHIFKLALVLCLFCGLVGCTKDMPPIEAELKQLQCDVLDSFMQGRGMASGEWQIYVNPNSLWAGTNAAIKDAISSIKAIEDSRRHLRKQAPKLKKQTIEGYKTAQMLDFNPSDCTFKGQVKNTQRDWDIGAKKMEGFSFQAGEYISMDAFSRVGFNKNRKQAMFFWLMNCNGGKCHTSAFVVMDNVDGRWVESDFILQSIG